MYTIKTQDNRHYIINPDGTSLKGWDGQPLQYGKLEAAEAVVNRLNNPQPQPEGPRQPQPAKGVVDNRHRNWRRRR